MLSVRWNVYRKKGKTVIPSRRLQAGGKTSALQTGKCTKIMRKIYQSSWSNDKDAFRKWEKKFYCIDPNMAALSCGCKPRIVKFSHPFNLQFHWELICYSFLKSVVQNIFNMQCRARKQHYCCIISPVHKNHTVLIF